MSVPNPIYIYRIVHWKNIEYILNYGICCKDHPDRDPSYISIGHNQLVKDRSDYPIPIEGYGTLGDYIPFYFWGHSPMLLMIANGYQGVEKHPQEDIVYIVIDSARILEYGLQYVFTDRHAKRKVARFSINPDDLAHLRWDIIKSKDWKSTEDDLERRDFKQAEFLVKYHIPVQLIETLVVKNMVKKLEIEEIVRKLGLAVNVVVAREGRLYY